MKHSDLKAGMFVHVDDGFTCMREGVHQVGIIDGELYLNCDAGYHILSGQCDGEGNLVGIGWGKEE
jgi:hypothetical protein